MATGRMRVSVGLTVTGSILLMAGLITMGAGEVMRLKSVHGGTGIVGLGEIVAACGLGCGLALLVTVAAGRPRRRAAARSRAPLRSRADSRSRLDIRSRVADRPRSGGRSRDASRSRDAARSQDAARSGRAGWPARSDRSRRQGRGGHTWNGDLEDAWRRDSADDWLSPLRNSAPAHAAEPDRQPAGPVSEFVPASDYADDGWQPEGRAAGPAARFRPAEPPPVTQPGGVHRAGGVTDPQPGYVTGPQPGYVTDPQPGHENVPSSLPASQPPQAETAGCPSAPAEPERPLAFAQAKLDQIKELYLTAAAIGEDALVRHFEEVSQRQRALIGEYFEQSGFGPNRAAMNPGDNLISSSAAESNLGNGPLHQQRVDPAAMLVADGRQPSGDAESECLM